MLKPITVAQLIAALKTIENKKALVGISVDSEGNGYSLIASEQFLMEGFMKPELGYAELRDEQEEGLVPAVILFGTN